MTERDGLGRTGPHYAAASPDTESLRALPAAGADVDGADDAGWTPLHFAAQAQAQAQAPAPVEILLAAGATVDAADRHGTTPLWRAVFCSRGQTAVIRLLLDAGADPDRKNRHGVGPRGLADRIANYDLGGVFSSGDRGSA
ncbi:ankyrin repeat domain-containing protein [Streptomyces albidoflavus]